MNRPGVLFLCTGNSARSQMAEGYLRHIAGDRFEVASAGIAPTPVNPLAIEAMREIGVDISRHTSKLAAGLLQRPFHYVITVCDSAGEQCPIFPGAVQRVHWSLEDPAAATGTQEQRLAVFRRIRDEIVNRIEQFAAEPDAHA
jgi:arsenate reductase